MSRRSGPVQIGLALLFSAAMLSGCANYSRDHVIVPGVPDDYRSRHPIVVAEAEQAVDIVVASDARSLSARDVSVVESFAHRFRRSGARTLVVLAPTGSANARAAAALARHTMAELSRLGVPRHAVQLSHYDGRGHGEAATLRLAYLDLTAKVEGKCGRWEEDIADTSENRNYANFGCATQQNLAAIVANPADLLGPRGESEIDATRRSTVIDDWREDGPRALPRLF